MHIERLSILPELTDTLVDTKAMFARRYIIDFHRHEDKERTSIDGSDEKLQLTPRGRINAALAGPKEGGFIFGLEDRVTASPRERTAHTALLRLFGNVSPAIDGSSIALSLAERNIPVDHLKAMIGSRFRVEPRLGFNGEAGNQFFDAYIAESQAGRSLDFMVHRSDELLIKTGLNKQGIEGYSIFAGNIASIIRDRVEEANIAKTPVTPEPIWEHAGTHAGIMESFLVKTVRLLAKEAGEDSADAQQRIFKVMNETNGFVFSEGVRVEIVSGKDSSEPQITVKYKKGDFILDKGVPIKILDQMIEEGELFKKTGTTI